MVQFECPRVIHPLVSLTFGVHCGLSFSLHAGKGKCCIWAVNKVEIHFSKIGFMESKWPTLNAPGSYTPKCHSLLGFSVGCPFLCIEEKGNAACGLLIKWKITFQQWDSWTSNGPIWMTQGHTLLGVIPFLGALWSAFFSAWKKGKCCRPGIRRPNMPIKFVGILSISHHISV